MTSLPPVFAVDDPPVREPPVRIPPVTGCLIAVNLLIHVGRLLLPPATDDALVNLFGFSPARLWHSFDLASLATLVTYQFLHQGWEHLAINMVSLLAFGAGVEAIGARRYLVLYFVSGIAGALLESIFNMNASAGVMVGASASISGIFGALIVLRGLYRIGHHPFGLARMAIVWIVLLAITGSIGVGAGGAPVAWIAHIGGFVSGLIFGFIFRWRAAAIGTT